MTDIVELMKSFSGIGQKNDTGIERLSLGECDRQARAALASEMQKQGLHVYQDAIGNQFGLVQPYESGLPVVLVGSHLDSQPDGGRFDGQAGVLAAFSTIVRLKHRDALSRHVNVGVVNWTNEEGARFQPSVMGSSVATHQIPLSEALEAVDLEGVRIMDELSLLQHGSPITPVADRLLGYAEMHVEQGPILEESKHDIGVVERTWAAYKADVSVFGVQTHTGPTPMSRRVDALYAASRVIAAVHEFGMNDASGRLHTAVAWIRVVPNSPNATPSRVDFKVELRSPDERRLSEVRDLLLAECSEITVETGTEFSFGNWSERHAAEFDEALVEEVFQGVHDQGLRVKRLSTIAGHDAVVTNAAGVPTALVFVPSQGGITHNAGEYTSDADLRRGETALEVAIGKLCDRVAALDER